MSFLENISPEVLNMKEAEFDVAMGYIDGKTDADLLIEETDEEDQSREKIHVLQVRNNRYSACHHNFPIFQKIITPL